MKNRFVILSLVLVAVILVSGCTQQKAEPTPTQTPVSTQAPVTATQAPTQTPAPEPIQVSVAGDVLGSELAKSDILDSELTDSDLDNLNSDLGEVESGL